MRVGDSCQAKRNLSHVEFMGGLLLFIIVGAIVGVILTLMGWWS
jgi:hypothetical protein